MEMRAAGDRHRGAVQLVGLQLSRPQFIRTQRHAIAAFVNSPHCFFSRAVEFRDGRVQTVRIYGVALYDAS